MTLQKRKPFRSRKILDAARGEECTMRIPDVCNHDPKTTVAAHSGWRIHGAGIGQKADDIFVAFMCSACHDVYDGRDQREDMGRRYLERYFQYAHNLTLSRLLEMGVLKVG